MPEQRKSYSCKLTPEEAGRLTAALERGPYRKVEVPYTTIAVKGEDCTVNLYTSGKLLVQGAGTEDFVLFVLEPEVLRRATLGYEEVVDPASVSPHMGIDESGKGDFFGPLVACAAYVDPNISAKMKEIGARDCKTMSDKQVLLVGSRLRAFLGPNRYKIVMIGPEAYNRLYARNRNVNSVLSWAHARAIENLLQTVPSCPRAVADQFGSEHLIKNALMKNGRGIVLEQHHKAESDIAVAAASVIARETFLLALKRLGETFGVTLPKGASAQVVDAATEFIKAHGPAELPKIAKCHFRTADQSLERAGRTRDEIGPLGAAVSRSPAQ
jgi:ribonuclease HIII